MKQETVTISVLGKAIVNRLFEVRAGRAVLLWNNSWDLNKSYVMCPACRTQLISVSQLTGIKQGELNRWNPLHPFWQSEDLHVFAYILLIIPQTVTSIHIYSLTYISDYYPIFYTDIARVILAMENLVNSIFSPPRRCTPEIGDVSFLLLQPVLAWTTTK